MGKKKEKEKGTFEITVERFFRHKDYTMGRMIIEDKVFCNVLEDTSRGLRQDMDEEIIRKRKIYGRTAIPTGRYHINMERYSPKFGKRKFYKDLCGGMLPEIEEVPCYDAVLIHCGNDPEDTCGCLLVGMNTEKGKVYKSQDTFKRLYRILKEHHEKGEEIYITIR